MINCRASMRCTVTFWYEISGKQIGRTTRLVEVRINFILSIYNETVILLPTRQRGEREHCWKMAIGYNLIVWNDKNNICKNMNTVVDTVFFEMALSVVRLSYYRYVPMFGAPWRSTRFQWKVIEYAHIVASFYVVVHWLNWNKKLGNDTWYNCELTQILIIICLVPW